MSPLVTGVSSTWAGEPFIDSNSKKS